LPVPVGISYRRQQQPLAFFAELAPIFHPAPTTSLGWGGGIGMRFNFGRMPLDGQGDIVRYIKCYTQ
jgi:hypothetical protein